MSRLSTVRLCWIPRAFGTALFLAVVVSSARALQGSSPIHRARLSADLLSHEARQTQGRAPVIVHGTADEIDALVARHHLSVLRRMGESAVVAADSAEVSELASDPLVDHLSGDARVRPAMSVSSASTGAATVRAGMAGAFGIRAIPGVTGQGVGVAVLDSGVSPHAALTNVVASVSFVSGDARVVDAFGHGTHVAGIVGGNAAAAKTVTSLYDGGIAPGARIINVRVLGPDGTGLTSDVIAGIEWAIDNRARYNIRVINLSLGHPVFEPAATDPLCEAVMKATVAGIVVVASAGNNGSTPDGRTVMGSISSPGNSPYALTVGALNTWQTTGRADDSVTTYSSRGPTRYDLAVKPDIVAPGNKIASLEADGSYLSTTYSSLHAAGRGTNAYMRLSGTSMAAPMVSGAVALLLQGDARLSVPQIKLALQTGATYLPDAGLMGAGAGSVDFWIARQTTANGLQPLLTQIMGLPLGPSGISFWDAGTLTNRVSGGVDRRPLSALEPMSIWLNPSLLRAGRLNLLGLSNLLAFVPPNRLNWGEVAGWTDGSAIMWGDTIYDPQGQAIMWGDTLYDPQGQAIMWGDSELTEDHQLMWGDTVLTSSDPR